MARLTRPAGSFASPPAAHFQPELVRADEPRSAKRRHPGHVRMLPEKGPVHKISQRRRPTEAINPLMPPPPSVSHVPEESPSSSAASWLPSCSLQIADEPGKQAHREPRALPKLSAARRGHCSIWPNADAAENPGGQHGIACACCAPCRFRGSPQLAKPDVA